MKSVLMKYFSDVFRAVGISLFVYSYVAFTFESVDAIKHKFATLSTFTLGLLLVVIGCALALFAERVERKANEHEDD